MNCFAKWLTKKIVLSLFFSARTIARSSDHRKPLAAIDRLELGMNLKLRLFNEVVLSLQPLHHNASII